jgi:branched-chain amino acid transport system permease protein
VVRTNEAVASSMGVSAHRYKVLAFTVASFYGGAAGFLYLVVVQYVSPELLGFLVTVHMLAALVIGGFMSIWGALLGGFFYVYVPVFAGTLDASRTSIFYGAALLLVLFLAPGGLVGSIARLGRIVGAKLTGTRPPAPEEPALTAHPSTTSTSQDTPVPDAPTR